MGGALTVETLADMDKHLGDVCEAARKAHAWIAEQSDEPIAFLKDVKFEKKGFHPVTHERLNLIEQVNQTWTYLVALEAARLLLAWHPDSEGFQLAPGAHASQPLDIMSVRSGLVGAETFAATSVLSNDKLNRDLARLKERTEVHRYVFFACPQFLETAEQSQFNRFGIRVVGCGLKRNAMRLSQSFFRVAR